MNKRGFKRQETKYAHYLYEEYDPPLFLIGVDKNYSKEEAELFIGGYIGYDKNIVSKLMTLPLETREIILNSIEEIAEDIKPKDSKTQYTYNPYNMDIVLDFILEITGKTTYDLAKGYVETLREDKQEEYTDEGINYENKRVLDAIESIRHGKGATHRDNKEIIEWILKQGNFNEYILTEGEGIWRFENERGECIDVVIKIIRPNKRIDEKAYRLINKLIEEYKKKQG